MAVLEARELYRFYHTEDEETLALKGISLNLSHGEFVGVQGPSGSGKSTLLACLAGLDEPDGGYVSVDGFRITRKSESVRAAVRAKQIGVVLQSGNLFDHLSVEENIRLQLRLARSEDKSRVDELLEQLGLRHLRRSKPSQISGGQAALTAMAVALSVRPALVLADEPTGRRAHGRRRRRAGRFRVQGNTRAAVRRFRRP